MGHFRGAEPLVGEIVGLRTFRVDQSGCLLPLYSPGAWHDGSNTAVCSPPTGHHHRAPHAVPADECECGFYAYGSVEAAAQNRHMRFVQAVVSCWGGVVAGTQGVRAEHARIDAIWVSDQAPQWLRRRIASRYSSAALYADLDAMLAEHPLTDLPCYTEPERKVRGTTVGTALSVALIIALGLLPVEVLRNTTALYALWLGCTAAVGALTLWFLVGTRGAGHVAAALIVAGFLGWLIAPLFGLPGWLLRVPLLRGAVVAGGAFLLSLRPGYFPVVVEPDRRRSFAGVVS